MQSPPEPFPPPQTGYQTPPPSPSKRRRLLRDSDETSGEISLEHYLYRSDDFRKSSFPTPLPLPLKRAPPDLEQSYASPAYDSLIPKIDGILQDHRIQKEQYSTHLALVSKPGYPGGSVPALTLIVYIDQGPNPSSNWGTARDELRALLASNGFPGVHVELLDLQRAFMPSIFSLLPKSDEVIGYESVRPEILQLIDSRLGSSWKAFSVFAFGHTMKKSKPALVVFVKASTSHDWKTLEHQLKNILRHTPQIEVEFLPGTIRDLAAVRVNLREPLAMGSSLDAVGQPGAGTLGGFVLLERNGKSQTGILTNHHVVRPDGQSPHVLAALAQYGYGDSTPGLPTTVQCPAAIDMEATRAMIEEARRQGIQDLDEHAAKIERYIMKGQDPPANLLQGRDLAQTDISAAEKNFKLLESLPIEIGKVLYSSGDAIDAKGTILDWAFVEMFNSHTKIVKPNRLPLPSHPAFENRGVQEFLLPPDTHNVEDPTHASSFGAIEKGKWYFKMGRTSRVTTGVCHGTELETNRKGQERYDENGKKVKLSERSTSELVILNTKPDLDGDSRQQDPFAKPGDSGSFVFDRAGNVAGLLYGELSGDVGRQLDGTCVQAGLVTSMEDIQASVEAKTGGVTVVALV